jgi:hypothetical protein
MRFSLLNWLRRREVSPISPQQEVKPISSELVNEIEGLSLEEIVNLRNFIKLEIGGRVGIVEGKIIPSGVPSADGYGIICWDDLHQKPGGKSIKLYGYFHPVEQIKPRFEQDRKREVSCGPAKRLSTLIRKQGEIYEFAPKDRIRGVSYCHPDSFDYPAYSARLNQEEFSLK